MGEKWVYRHTRRGAQAPDMMRTRLGTLVSGASCTILEQAVVCRNGRRCRGWYRRHRIQVYQVWYTNIRCLCTILGEERLAEEKSGGCGRACTGQGCLICGAFCRQWAQERSGERLVCRNGRRWRGWYRRHRIQVYQVWYTNIRCLCTIFPVDSLP